MRQSSDDDDDVWAPATAAKMPRIPTTSSLGFPGADDKSPIFWGWGTSYDNANGIVIAVGK